MLVTLTIKKRETKREKKREKDRHIPANVIKISRQKEIDSDRVREIEREQN